MQNDSFKLILRSKSFTIPSVFKNLVNISQTISRSLIFNSNHEYQVESNVSDEVFQSFIEYLVNDRLPEIEIETFDEFLQLSEEFQILREFIEEKRGQFGEYLVNLNGLKDTKNVNHSIYTEKVAMKLDDYIENYGDILMKLPIQTLHIVFNHKKRNLTNHNDAYEMINKYFERTNDRNVFILLESLDGSKLSKSNIEESFKKRKSRMNYMPNIKFSYLSDSFEKQRKLEEKVTELENVIKDFFLKYENEKKLMSQQIEKDKSEILVRNQNELKNLQNEISKEIDCKVNEFKKKYEDEHNLLIQQNEKEISILKKNHSEEIEKLNEKIELLSKQINEKTENNETKITSLNTKLDEIKSENISEKTASLEKSYEFHKQIINGINKKFNFILAEMSLEDPGILHLLKKKEKTCFDKLFIASQSTRDVYNLINPNTADDFRFSTHSDDFIEFNFEQKISINGIKIFSSFEYFPKSFDIEVNGTKVISIKDANELNGQNLTMTYNFDTVLAQKIRFIQTGSNWDDGSYYLRIKKFELLSSEPEYSNGIFQTLIEKSENHDPHKCPIFISSSYFDFNKFYTINVEIGQNICTYDEENSWFQIELTQGFAILKGFRFKRSSNNMPKNYKIICTDDLNKPENSWITLIEINEKTKDEHQILDIYKFPHPSPPVKIIRLIQTGKNWDDADYLLFYHFDVFGVYF